MIASCLSKIKNISSSFAFLIATKKQELTQPDIKQNALRGKITILNFYQIHKTTKPYLSTEKN
jgi:hypothetical protein